jgi:hypothetical protein
VADQGDVRARILTMSLLASTAIGAGAGDARADIAVSGTPYLLTAPDGPVSSAVADATVDGLGAIQRYTREHLGVAVARRTTVRMLRSQRCGAGFPVAGANVGGQSTKHLICLYTGSSAYPSEPYRRAEVAAHEAVHVLQGELGCRLIPLWLAEGMAEDLAWRATMGIGSYDQLVATAKVSTRYNGLSKQGLRTHELSLRGISYPEVALAAITAEGGQPRRFVSFCRAVARGVLWPKAFGPAFGVDINTFYRRFADLRHELAAK